MGSAFGVKMRGDTSREPVALLFELSRMVAQGSTAHTWKAGEEAHKRHPCVDVLLPCRLMGCEAACHTSSSNGHLHLLKGKTIILVPKALANCLLFFFPTLPNSLILRQAREHHLTQDAVKQERKPRKALRLLLPGSLLTNDRRLFRRQDKVCSRSEPSEEQQAVSAPPRLPPTSNDDDVTWGMEQSTRPKGPCQHPRCEGSTKQTALTVVRKTYLKCLSHIFV